MFGCRDIWSKSGHSLKDPGVRSPKGVSGRSPGSGCTSLRKESCGHRHVRRVRRACKLGKGEWEGIQWIPPLRPITHTRLLVTKKIRTRGGVGSFLQVCDLAQLDGVCQDRAGFPSCNMDNRSLGD